MTVVSGLAGRGEGKDEEEEREEEEGGGGGLRDATINVRCSDDVVWGGGGRETCHNKGQMQR